MSIRFLGKTGVKVSQIALGGHEFHPDGSVKGFARGRDATRNPDYVDPGFAGADRQALVRAAIDAGINYFDATIDPEVAALGKLLPKGTGIVQCRPQWMCYKYETGNLGLADSYRLRAEVERLLKLLKRDRIDVLNFGMETPAIEQDAKFLDKVGANIALLKKAGLIRFAACDSIDSGQTYYETMMRSGHFDLIWIHFSPLWPFPAEKLFGLARELNLGVVTREAFAKGKLFQVADAAQLPVSRSELAALAIRWILNHPEISTMVLGVRNTAELASNLSAAQAAWGEKDDALLDQLKTHPAFITALTENELRFRV